MPKILEVSKTPAFLATLKGFVGFCGVQTYQVGDEMMVTHSRWASKVACEGGAAALGQVLKGHVADFIAGPPAPASVGPGMWAWTSSKSSGAKGAHRITVLKLKSSEVMDQALALAKSKEADFDAIEGLVDITSFSTEANDALVVVAGYTTMAALEAASPKIGEILKEMGPLFGGPPEAMSGTTQFAYPEPLVSRPCIHIVWRVPSADEAEVDAYWKSHEEWMKGSHVMGLEGDDAVAPRLLEFYISKGEELNNPLDPASGKTGNLLYIMSETYAAAAGIGSHMEKGTKDWPGMAKLGEMGAKYNVFMEAGATSVFTNLDGGVLKPAPGSAPTVEQLTGLGLPQAQAEASLKVIAEKPPVTGIPTHVYGMMKVKEGADIEAMTAGLEAYGAASKACPGKVSASYTISDGEIQFIEIYDSPAAMDIHIGFCFPEYVKIVPHADMTELIIQTDPSQLDFWKTSASAWGATKFIVAAAK